MKENPNIEKISDSEVEVLKVIWTNDEPMTFARIKAILNEQTGWENSTIQTLISRLVKKGALKQEKLDVYYYSAVISETEFMDYRTRSFVEKVYGGNAKGLISALFKRDYIDEKDLEELQDFWNQEDK